MTADRPQPLACWGCGGEGIRPHCEAVTCFWGTCKACKAVSGAVLKLVNGKPAGFEKRHWKLHAGLAGTRRIVSACPH